MENNDYEIQDVGSAHVVMKDGRIANNIAKSNGGGIFLAGAESSEEYPGSSCIIDGGVITGNHAYKQGGGFYLENHSTLEFNKGAVYFNVAGEQGNTATGKDEAGAEIYSEGNGASLTIPTAEQITEYIQSKKNKFVPEKDRNVWFTSWYDDYSDKDKDFGKGEGKEETGVHTGRYMSTKVIDRQEFTPSPSCGEYKALILDRQTELDLSKVISGKDMIRDEVYEFEVTFHNLPSADQGGTKYPISSTLSTDNSYIGTLENGKQYITLDGNGQMKFNMKADEDIVIKGLPAGTSFSIVESDAKGAKETEITTRHIEEEEKNQTERTIEGKTNTQWKAETDYFKTGIVFNNIYTDTDEPTTPDQPDVPDQPNQPDVPTTPDQPTQPDLPVPDKDIDVIKPQEPDKGVTVEKPNKGNSDKLEQVEVSKDTNVSKEKEVKKTTTTTGKSVKTSDINNLELWTMGAILSAGVLVVLIRMKKRKIG